MHDVIMQPIIFQSTYKGTELRLVIKNGRLSDEAIVLLDAGAGVCGGSSVRSRSMPTKNPLRLFWSATVAAPIG